ncbi:MAG TPA: helix-turn-helix transcriptional regulator [Mycobacteriales bacterium]|nr:helix-turn-helix transcriptional regulator [Mycobacteriales bacterium]
MPSIEVPNKVLRKVREDHGLTQEEMAKACAVAPRTYQMWESGRIRTPREGTLTGIYRLTGLSRPEELGFHAQPLPPRPMLSAERLIAAVVAALKGHPPAAVTSLLAPRRAGGVVGATERDRIRTRTTLLSGVYDQWGGGAVALGALTDTMRHAGGYLRARFVSERARAEMWAAVADLSVVVAMMLADQAAFDTAQASLLIGLTATRDAGEERSRLRGRILAQLARQSLGRRDLRNAHGLLDLADNVAESQRLPTDVLALLTALRAGETGILGSLGETRTLAERSLDLHASASGTVVPISEVICEAGFGLACLELCAGLEVDHATAMLNDAIAAFSPLQLRQRTHARTFRLMTLTERGDVAAAMHVVADLRTDVESLRSALVRESLALTHLVPRVVRGEPEASQISAMLHAYPAPVAPEILRTHPGPADIAAALHAAS